MKIHTFKYCVFQIFLSLYQSSDSIDPGVFICTDLTCISLVSFIINGTKCPEQLLVLENTIFIHYGISLYKTYVNKSLDPLDPGVFICALWNLDFTTIIHAIYKSISILPLNLPDVRANEEH
jgi:hypothetical protein